MRLSTHELATVAVFGTLWGVVEISLGSVLKSLNIPFSGMVLSAIGLTIALVGRLFVPRRGSTLFVGAIAMLLKLFSLGGVVLGPMVAILAEALIAEGVLSLFAAPRRLASLLAGGLGVLWALLQPFVTGPLLFGRSVYVVWLDLLDRGSQLLGLNASAILAVVGGLAAIHLALGAAAGWLSWGIAHQLQARLGRSVPLAPVALLLLAWGLGACAAPATPAPSAPAAPAEASLSVSGGEIAKSYTRADLEALPATQAVFREVTYRGVALPALLQAAGFDPQQIKAVKAVASDGFTVNYDASQFRREDCLVAYATVDGELSAEEGTFRMVLPGADGKLNPRMLVALQVLP